MLHTNLLLQYLQQDHHHLTVPSSHLPSDAGDMVDPSPSALEGLVPRPANNGVVGEEPNGIDSRASLSTLSSQVGGGAADPRVRSDGPLVVEGTLLAKGGASGEKRRRAEGEDGSIAATLVSLSHDAKRRRSLDDNSPAQIEMDRDAVQGLVGHPEQVLLPVPGLLDRSTSMQSPSECWSTG